MKTTKVKAWAILEENDLALFWQGKALVYEIYFSKKYAETQAKRYNKYRKFNFVVSQVEIKSLI